MKWQFIIPLVCLPIIAVQSRAIAHGAIVQYQQTRAIEIVATYESGTPMANAQVTIYSPDRPTTPWKTGTADDEGRYTFTPDPSKPGNWAVRVRLAGHGEMVNIPIEESQVTSTPNTEASDSPRSQASNSGLGERNFYSVPQKGLMLVSVVWGSIGTALFFSRKKSATPEKTRFTPLGTREPGMGER